MTTLQKVDELMEAAMALLEARDDKMLTQAEWDRLREALLNLGCAV